MALRSTMGPRLRALHRAEDIGSALKRGVNVCQRRLVNEVLWPLVTEFVRNFGREGATSIQLGPNASLFGCVQAVKHSALLIESRRTSIAPTEFHRQLADDCIFWTNVRCCVVGLFLMVHL